MRTADEEAGDALEGDPRAAARRRRPVMAGRRRGIGLPYAVWGILLPMIALSMTLSVLTLEYVRLARILSNSESRLSHLDEGFRAVNRVLYAISVNERVTIPWAGEAMAHQLQRLDDYVEDRSRHRRRTIERQAFQRTDADFRRYREAYEVVVAEKAALVGELVDVAGFEKYIAEYTHAENVYLESLNVGSKKSRAALKVMAVVQIVTAGVRNHHIVHGALVWRVQNLFFVNQ